MFRKILMFLIVALFAMTPAVFASGGGYSGSTNHEVNGNYYAEGHSADTSNAVSQNNDVAGAGVEGMATGEVTTFGSASGTHQEFVRMERTQTWHPGHSGYWSWHPGYYTYTYTPVYETVPNEARQQGSATAHSNSEAWSYANDYGRQSTAEAGANFYGGAATEGSAYGHQGDAESVDNYLTLGAGLSQHNYAAEVRPNRNSFVEGGNSGTVEFQSTADGYSYTGSHSAFGGGVISGQANVEGSTFVQGDFRGANRSISATTQNSGTVGTSGTMEFSQVTGEGTVRGNIANGYTQAGGSSSFNYNGTTSGHGQAQLNSSVHSTGTSSTATSSGSSSSVGN